MCGWSGGEEVISVCSIVCKEQLSSGGGGGAAAAAAAADTSYYYYYYLNTNTTTTISTTTTTTTATATATAAVDAVANNDGVDEGEVDDAHGVCSVVDVIV
ncbi:unnamed protein product [Schistosoma mattheei]|uniref:Uncharacterized protein n=1 Tax=Schistosoma mattheei TaxID=31246 RepID=A0AA85BXQ7_9TREM|nr:unnamed protein product [Schistosoma mattheei]